MILSSRTGVDTGIRLFLKNKSIPNLFLLDIKLTGTYSGEALYHFHFSFLSLFSMEGGGAGQLLKEISSTVDPISIHGSKKEVTTVAVLG